MIAPIPKNEQRRLEVVWQYELLDTPPEEVFDELTQLAALICEAPISLISLVDEKRQWFKSKVGISASETSRDISFCAHAMLQTNLFIVPDALKDKRFKNNPLVTSDPFIRFYAGAPLITPDGHALGSLCVIDKVPRDLHEDQQKALRLLARHVVSLLELRRRALELKKISADRDQIQRDLSRTRAELARLQPRTKPAARKATRPRAAR